MRQVQGIYCKLLLVKRSKILFCALCKMYLYFNVLRIDPEEKLLLKKIPVERFSGLNFNERFWECLHEPLDIKGGCHIVIY